MKDYFLGASGAAGAAGAALVVLSGEGGVSDPPQAVSMAATAEMERIWRSLVFMLVSGLD
jgi:hypothetical protein